MADQDYGHCDCCGNPLTEEDVYCSVRDAIGDLLNELDPYAQMSMVALFAGRVVATFDAEDQKSVRRELSREITRETKEWNIAFCDA